MITNPATVIVQSSQALVASGAGIGYPRQLTLPGISNSGAEIGVTKRKSQQSVQENLIAQDPMWPSYVRRLEARGAAQNGVNAYRYQLGTLLRIATRDGIDDPILQRLFEDVLALGRILTDDIAPTGDGRLSKWTLAQRRSAIRSFAALMSPELRDLLGDDPLDRVEKALQSAADRVGSGYRLTGGSPRNRGGYVPTPTELTDVIEATGRTPGFFGLRNRVFFKIMAQTGTRVNSLRVLSGCDCVELPSGRMRIFVHDKGKLEPREVELSLELSTLFQEYVDFFNQFASGRRWKTRIVLGASNPVWRNSARGCWPYQDVLHTLCNACDLIGVPAFSPHALRRAFATDAASVLPQDVVALAGGWQGLNRLDDHYVRPRRHEMWSKFERNLPDAEPAWRIERVKHAATLFV